MHGGLWQIPLVSHLTSLKTTPRRQRNLHPPQHHRLSWNEAGIGDPSATPKLFSRSRFLARGNLSGHPSPSRPSPTPGSLWCIFFPAKGRAQDPPAKMALLGQQTLPPCTTRTRMGRRTGTDPSQSTTRGEVPQSAQGPAEPNL